MIALYEVTACPLFFYNKYFLFYVPIKKFEFKLPNFSSFFKRCSYDQLTQNIILNFFSIRLQIISCLPQGFYVFSRTRAYSVAYNFYFVSLVFFLFNFISGFSKSFKSKLYLIGLRVKIEKIYKKSVILKLNLCHKIK